MMPLKDPDANREYHKKYRQRPEIREKYNAYGREYYRKFGKKKTPRSVATFRYGLTLDEYGALEEDQNWLCAICKKEGRLNLDHNHETGKARQFLCTRCNYALVGIESPMYPQYVAYLQKHEAYRSL